MHGVYPLRNCPSQPRPGNIRQEVLVREKARLGDWFQLVGCTPPMDWRSIISTGGHRISEQL